MVPQTIDEYFQREMKPHLPSAWIVTNKKAAERKGKVQLINATGKKDEELMADLPAGAPAKAGNGDEKGLSACGNAQAGIGFITKIYGDFEENEFCKIYPNELVETIHESSLRDKSKKKLVPQTIDEYFQREMKPHLPSAWIDESKTKIGYEINFAKYFYEFKPLRALTDIKADILALEQETVELEKKVLD